MHADTLLLGMSTDASLVIFTIKEGQVHLDLSNQLNIVEHYHELESSEFTVSLYVVMCSGVLPL